MDDRVKQWALGISPANANESNTHHHQPENHHAPFIQGRNVRGPGHSPLYGFRLQSFQGIARHGTLMVAIIPQ